MGSQFLNRVHLIPAGASERLLSIMGKIGNYVFSAGRSQRDFQTLISATKGLNIKVIIAAYGSSYPKIENPDIEVYFDMPRSTYEKYLSEAMCVVVPLKGKVPPAGATVVRESMAMGKCIIATRNLDTVDYIKNGETGYLVEPEDVAGLRQKIMLIKGNLDESMRLGSKARKYIEKYRTERLMAMKFLDVIYSKKL
jgi:glycosyltransferase involved in cell wall biosynthesis